jgi:hypothetical protein
MLAGFHIQQLASQIFPLVRAVSKKIGKFGPIKDDINISIICPFKIFLYLSALDGMW